MDEQPAPLQPGTSISPQPTNPTPTPEQPVTPPPKTGGPYKKAFYGLLVLVLIVLGVAAYVHYQSTKPATQYQAKQSASQNQTKDTAKVQGLQLDTAKNYGNKYSDGILPVGDGKYVTDAAKTGYVYVCNANFVPAGQAGAQTRGPWFIGTTQWNVNKKVAVQGAVSWIPSFSNTVQSDTRLINTNDLPSHTTGVFPIRSTDPAYTYDRNPNTISAQTLSYNLRANPVYGSPQCMGGEVGVMLTGVALFNAFDAGGRDAGAWEVQDSCNGHPQNKGEYHYHSLSACIKNTSVSTVIGFALDGFPITGPKVGNNNILTTNDLDECHGIVSQVTLDGKKVARYHYVMTQDFPYSASCFRGTAIQPPGNHETSGQPARPPQ